MKTVPCLKLNVLQPFGRILLKLRVKWIDTTTSLLVIEGRIVRTAIIMPFSTLGSVFIHKFVRQLRADIPRALFDTHHFPHLRRLSAIELMVNNLLASRSINDDVTFYVVIDLGNSISWGGEWMNFIDDRHLDSIVLTRWIASDLHYSLAISIDHHQI